MKWLRALVVALACGTVVSEVAQASPAAPASSTLATIGQRMFTDLQSDNVADATHLFFPESAYATMKTGRLANPAIDYVDRLWAFFRLDIAAYHARLQGAPVQYLRTEALANAATWISPGVCENGVGYWHEPAIRLVYEQGGVIKSFAVDSLISWGGRYYIIHLGPNPRPVNVGTVDAPRLGAGVPGPAGGC